MSSIPRLPAIPKPKAANNPARRIRRTSLNRPAAAFCAVIRIITVGIAAAVTAYTGENKLCAVEKYPIPSPPMILVSGILRAAPISFVIAIAANKIMVFLSIWFFMRNSPRQSTSSTSLWGNLRKNAFLLRFNCF
jgi:hypothetical protein